MFIELAYRRIQYLRFVQHNAGDCKKSFVYTHPTTRDPLWIDGGDSDLVQRFLSDSSRTA
jgi:hypothetical protein